MPPVISHFFAYLGKMRWIERWGMKRNAIRENVMEHSYEVAVVAHALAVIRQELLGDTDINPEQIAVAALFHDASEVLTGDLPSPIKYHNQKIRDAYKAVEYTAEREMLATLPAALQPHYGQYLLHENIQEPARQLIKAADLIASFTKARAEVNAGNLEFSKAAQDIEQRLAKLEQPEVRYFCSTFLPSFDLTLDEILRPDDHA